MRPCTPRGLARKTDSICCCIKSIKRHQITGIIFTFGRLAAFSGRIVFPFCGQGDRVLARSGNDESFDYCDDVGGIDDEDAKRLLSLCR